MGFELKDSIENPQQPTDPKADVSVKALAEVTPPVPSTASAGGTDEGQARKKDHKRNETFTGAYYPAQSDVSGGILDFANNSVIKQPVTENAKLKLASSFGADVQQQITSTMQPTRVEAGKTEQKYPEKKETYVDDSSKKLANAEPMQPIRIEHSQSYASSNSRLEANRWAADSSTGASVSSGTVRAMADVSRTDALVQRNPESYTVTDPAVVKKIAEQASTMTYSDVYGRGADKQKEGYSFSQPDNRGLDPAIANKMTFDREAIAMQRDLRTISERTTGPDTNYSKIENQKINGGDFTPYVPGNKIPADRLANLDPNSRTEGISGGMRPNPGPGPGIDWNTTRLGKEPGSQPGDGRQLADQERGHGGPGGIDPYRLTDSGKLPSGQGPNDLARQTDTGRGPSGTAPLDPTKPVGPEQNHNPEPTRLARDERPVQSDIAPGPVRQPNLPTPVVTGLEGPHPVEVAKVKPTTELELHAQENPGPKLPQIDVRRQDGSSPEPVVHLAGGPTPQIHLELKEGTGPQIMLDKSLVKVDRREEDQVSRPRNPVGPGSSPVSENVPEIRLAMTQPVFRGTLDRTSGPGDPAVIAMPVKPAVSPDGTRADVRPLNAPDSQGIRPALDTNGAKPVALTAGVIPGVNTEADRRTGPVALQNQGDLSNAVKQAIPTRPGVDGLDPRTVKTDATTTTGITKPADVVVKTDAIGASRPVGADAMTPGVVKTDLAQVPGRAVVDAGAQGTRAGEVGTTHRVPGELTGAAGQHIGDGPNGKLPGKLTGGLEDVDALSGRAQRSGLVSQVVPLTDRRTLTGKLNADESLDGGKDGLQSKDKLTAGAKRYMTGAEIALAVVVASGGIRRIRGKGRVKAEAGADGSADQLTGLELQEQNESATAEQWFSMNTMKKLGRIAHGELQKSRSDQVLKRPTYLVSRSDTLTSIAEKLFEDEDLGWLIADVNAGGIRESMVNGKRIVELQDRQQIDLPVWEDIADFYELRPEGAIAENLVTIVAATHISSEIVDLMLSPVMGVASPSVDPFGRVPAASRQSARTEAPAAVASARTGSAAQANPAAAGFNVQQLGQHLSHVAAALNPFPNHWPKPPAAMTGDLTAQERHA